MKGNDAGTGGLLAAVLGLFGIWFGNWLSQRAAKRQQDLAARVEVQKLEQAREDAWEGRILVSEEKTRHYLVEADAQVAAMRAALHEERERNRELWQQHEKAAAACAECDRLLEAARRKQAELERSLFQAEERVMALAASLQETQGREAALQGMITNLKGQVDTLTREVTRLQEVLRVVGESGQ